MRSQQEKRQRHDEPKSFGKDGAIRHYLSVNVKPVKLPERDQFTAKDRIRTYPPLILDGASGVGKTQQAFALLKGEESRNGEAVQEAQKLVYVLLSKNVYEANPTVQQIYQEMIKATKMSDLNGTTGKIDQVLKEMKTLHRQYNRTSDQNNVFSMKMIEKALENGTEIWKLVGLICSKVIEYDSTDKVLLCDNFDTKNENRRGKMLEYLKDKVLFVDEVLPSSTVSEVRSKDPEEWHLKLWVTFQNLFNGPPPVTESEKEKAKNRLKFLRNFGRQLEMRVVLAGTAATAANMSTNHEANSASRFQKSDMTWAEVLFLYKPIETLQIGTKSNFKVRPLVHKWLEEASEDARVDIYTAIGFVSQMIPDSKAFSNESKFVWASGACLSGKENNSSPFLLQPSELVRGHFFEPAIATYTDENGQQRIYEGTGFHEISRKVGQHRLQIIKANCGENLMWLLKGDKFDVVALSAKYGSVEYALSSNCVQICLATEPFFAVAIALANRYKDYNGKKQDAFREGICQALPETLMQRSKGELDGELHEYIIFAALQLACTEKGLGSKVTVKECVEFLNKYLKIESNHSLYNDAVEGLKAKHGGKFELVEKPNNPQGIECAEFKDESGDVDRTLDEGAATLPPGHVNNRIEVTKANIDHKGISTGQHILANTKTAGVQQIESTSELGANSPPQLVEAPYDDPNSVKRHSQGSPLFQNNESTPASVHHEEVTPEESFNYALNAGQPTTLNDELGSKPTSQKDPPPVQASDFFETELMPWLVPACDKDELVKQIQTLGSDFFGNLGVAGLIPGARNSRMDAHAYTWENFQNEEDFMADWEFEFRARSNGYPEKTAMGDLMTKCQDKLAMDDEKKCTEKAREEYVRISKWMKENSKGHKVSEKEKQNTKQAVNEAIDEKKEMKEELEFVAEVKKTMNDIHAAYNEQEIEEMKEKELELVAEVKKTAKHIIYEERRKNQCEDIKETAKTAVDRAIAAVKVLKAAELKLEILQKIKERRKWPIPKPCHGMLIAIVNSKKSICRYCAVKAVDGVRYLRVVVLIGNAHV